MIPKTYQPYKDCRDLQGDDLELIQNDSDLQALLDNVSFPKKYRQYITGAIVGIEDGDYTQVWLTESGAYYSLSATYHPLSFYRPTSWAKGKLPRYWREDCPAYQRR
jgi:hypothetical protein